MRRWGRSGAEQPQVWQQRRGDRGPDLPNTAREALNEMYREYGPRVGERQVMQISSLRGVLNEAEELLAARGTSLQAEAVETLLSNYAHDARVDEDPHIQCLCHLLLTAAHALNHHQQPMWLTK